MLFYISVVVVCIGCIVIIIDHYMAFFLFALVLARHSHIKPDIGRGLIPGQILKMTCNDLLSHMGFPEPI